MRNRFIAFAAGLMTAGLGYSSAWAQSTITLKVAHPLPANHFAWESGIKNMTDEITKKTGGKVQFQIFPAGQLGKDNYAILKSGIADIAMVVPNYTPDKFPLTSVMELPGFYNSSCEGTKKYLDLALPDGALGKKEYAPLGIRAFSGRVESLRIPKRRVF